MDTEETLNIPGSSTPSPAPSLPEVKGFRMLAELARSPKGVTYKARRQVEQDVVALKVFRPSLCTKKFVTDLPKNAESTFFLEHKGLVRSLGCVHENGSLLLISEYAPGQSLSRLLKDGKIFQVVRALRIVLHCATALRHAASHNAFHGRLHPADIIVSDEDSKILGVGLGERPEHAAWAARDAYLFEPLIYTPAEAMPSAKFPALPESQIAVDVYSLGAILFHMLTGAPPFFGTDEGALDTERKRLNGKLQWRDGLNEKLPRLVIALTEKMLADDPGRRPLYPALISDLTAAIAEAEKIEPEIVKEAPAKVATQGAYGGVFDAVKSSRPTPPPMVTTPRPPQPENNTATMSVLTKIYTAVLVGMTALVFMAALGLAAKIFLYDQLKPPVITVTAPVTPHPNAQAVTPVQPNVAQPILVQTPPPPAQIVQPAQPNLKSDDYVTATKQLDLIQEMLTKQEAKHSPALLRLARSIAEKAGRDTPTGVKAIVLAAEIEESLMRESGVKPDIKSPFATQENTPAGAIPGVGKTGQTSEVATAEAPKASPPPTQKTEPATPKATPPEDKAAPKPAEKEPEKTPLPPEAVAVAMPKADPARLAGPVKAVAQKAKLFQYTDLKTELEKNVAAAQGDDKTFLERYGQIAKQEQDLVKRCRTRLLEQIEKSPKRESPLQVFPRRNDPVGDDIVDFDESGLKIQTRKGAAVTVRTQAWEKVPAAQAFVLLQLLTDKNNADDQSGLAVFAFHRGLKDEQENALNQLRMLGDGNTRATALSDAFKNLSAVIEMK